MTDSLILRAARFARDAHAGQRRKYSGRPYIDHPARVASQASLLDEVTPEEVAAAWLHDVIEDCGVSEQDLVDAGFPPPTVALVVELTNSSKGLRPFPRATKKQMDRDRLRHVSRRAKRLKLLDRIDNLQGLAGADDDFRNLYVAESVLLIECIGDAAPELAESALVEIERMGFPRDHRHPQ
jgi:(p)ppGpp synthase/HD superfamily hydrolase